MVCHSQHMRHAAAKLPCQNDRHHSCPHAVYPSQLQQHLRSQPPPLHWIPVRPLLRPQSPPPRRVRLQVQPFPLPLPRVRSQARTLPFWARLSAPARARLGRLPCFPPVRAFAPRRFRGSAQAPQAASCCAALPRPAPALFGQIRVSPRQERRPLPPHRSPRRRA